MSIELPQGEHRLKILSTDQVRDYRVNGFLIVRHVFDPTRLGLLAQDVDRIFTQQRALLDPQNMRVRFTTSAQTGESICDVLDPLLDLSPVAQSIVHDPLLLDILHDLYGEPAELFKDKWIQKPAGAKGLPLHQDWISWPGFPQSFVTVLLAIDAFTETNGATEVFPGEHQRGYLAPMDGHYHTLSEELFSCAAVPLILEPGDVAIFGCLLPHRSAANAGSTSRRGYFLSYNARSDGGNQYDQHYRQFHQWIRSKAPDTVRDQLTFR